MTHVLFCQALTPSNGLVLDVGSGRGGFLCAMAKLGFRSFGVETNPEYIAETEESARAAGVSVAVVSGRGESLPFPDNHFDFVNCAEVTEHVENPAAVCREIFRVLKPGGKSYVSFHNRFGIYDYHYRLWGINWLPRTAAETLIRLFGRTKPDGAGIGRQALATMHYFTYGQVKKIMTDCGFTFVDSREEKIKKRFPFASGLVLALYRPVARPVLFNSFHLLAAKPSP